MRPRHFSYTSRFSRSKACKQAKQNKSLVTGQVEVLVKGVQGRRRVSCIVLLVEMTLGVLRPITLILTTNWRLKQTQRLDGHRAPCTQHTWEVRPRLEAPHGRSLLIVPLYRTRPLPSIVLRFHTENHLSISAHSPAEKHSPPVHWYENEKSR